MEPIRRPILAVIALNAILLGAIALVSFAPRSEAQGVRRSTYTMVSGTVNGQIIPVLYIVDEGSGELVAVTWDDQNKTFNGMGYRNLAADSVEFSRSRN